MTYKIVYSHNGIPLCVQTEDMSIPFDESNRDFRAFFEWNTEQETPLDWKTPISVEVPLPEPSLQDQVDALTLIVQTLAGV